MAQLELFKGTAWEKNKLSEFVTIKCWTAVNTTRNCVAFIPFIIDDYKINRRGRIINKHNKDLSGTFHPNGYNYLELRFYSTKGWSKAKISRHRLVACTFIPCENREKFKVIDHIDGNTKNNHYLNLRWTTQQENLKKVYNKNQLKII